MEEYEYYQDEDGVFIFIENRWYEVDVFTGEYHNITVH